MNILSLRALTLALAACLSASALASPAGPAAQLWQGTLQDGNGPANGRYDIQVQLHGSRDEGKALAEPITYSGVPVKQGQFDLPLELAPWLQAQSELWLQISVRAEGDGAFEKLPERAALKAGGPVCWNTRGNAGNTGGLDFLGTTDEQGLEFRVNNRRVAVYGFVGNQLASPVVIAGYEQNLTLSPGTVIAGGGLSGFANIGFSAYSTISGGYGNVVGVNNVSSGAATVGGGYLNRAAGASSVVAGGAENRANGVESAVGGGMSNIANAANSTVAGGLSNTAGDRASVGGGELNQATGAWSAVPGGRANLASGISSFAAGDGARATHLGAFVWSDGLHNNFGSQRNYQMRFGAAGGVHIQGASDLGVDSVSLGSSDPVELVVEAADAQNYLMSDNVGTIGSVLALGEMDNSNLVNTWAIARETTGAGGGLRFAFGSNAIAGTNTVRVKFNSNGTVFKSSGSSSWDVVSDARLKTELGPVEHALERLLQLRGVRFEYRADVRPYGMSLPKGEQIGFIAQEVQQVFPDWVNTSDDGTLTIGERGTTALLVEALRELADRNAALEQQLQARDTALEARIAALERAR